MTTINGLTETKTRQWIVTFPAPMRMWSTNQITNRGAIARNRNAWRETAWAHFKRAHLPTGLDRIRMDIELRFPRNADRDEPNYSDTIGKPIIDAAGREQRYVRAGKLVIGLGYGVITDDTSKHKHCASCPHITFGPVTGTDPRRPFGEVVVTITDLSGDSKTATGPKAVAEC